MSFAGDNEIVAIGYDGKEIRIAYNNVSSLREYSGVHVIDNGGVSMAGAKKEYVLIETSGGEKIEIPRDQGNDTQILNFLLRWRRP